jgi:uncharacterized membrane protein
VPTPVRERPVAGENPERALRPRVVRVRRVLLPRPYDPGGAVGAVLFACMSLTPSLMPRSPAFQGVVSGTSAACGYAIGVLVGRLIARRVRWRPDVSSRSRVQAAGAGLAAAVLVATILASAGWQREVHQLVGLAPPGEFSPVLTVSLGAGVFIALVGAVRLAARAAAAISQPFAARVPPVVAAVLSVLVVALAVGALLDKVVARAVLAAVDRSFDTLNNGTHDGISPPTSRLRSGGPGSILPWDELGVYGRTFVASGPTAAELAESADRPAREPIRVYAGLDTEEDLEVLAARAVRELERTGAFERAVLCVATATGRGWVNPVAAAALEHLHAGDTAIVAMQYSYLPSPLAFLVDPERAKEAGQQLFDQVHARWAELPESSRPRLVVYGESLGSTGAQAAFAGLGGIRSRTDGALFVGPPESNTLWSQLVARRDPGTPQIQPVYDDGLTVRFRDAAEQVHRPEDGRWETPRVLFLQHPSDPAVWWSSDLLLRRPDWLEEARGADVSTAMRWYPLVTFWQVTADLAVANTTPVGHGHRYGGFVSHWAALVPPDGWTDQQTRTLSARLRR